MASSWLCGTNRDMCGAGPKDFERMQSPNERERAAKEQAQKLLNSAPDPLEEAHVVETVRAWLELREIADTQGAALLSTSDIMVRTPLGAVQGIEKVKAQIYAAASPPLSNSTELVAKRASPGVWTVRRHYVVAKDGTEFTLRQDWLVVCNPNPHEVGRRKYEPLIAEVTSSIA